MHSFATCMVSLGAHFSAVWIVVANSWMQTPAGYVIEGEGLGARAVITDFWAMVFNPSSVDRLTHTLIGAWLAGAFLVVSVSSYYLLKGRHRAFARASLKIALGVAFVSCILQGISGDSSARQVARQQPAKLAAMEALYTTEKGAPLYLFGIPDSPNQRIDYGVKIPGLLSFLIDRNFHSEVPGLDKVPKADWPKVGLVFQTYRIMIAMWALMLLCCLLGLCAWRRGSLETSPWTLRLLTLSVLCPQIANQVGWITAECGRYPWIVYGLLRISDGLSKSVIAGQILASMIMFGTVYFMLGMLFLYLLNHKIQVGPVDDDSDSSYHHMRDLTGELPS